MRAVTGVELGAESCVLARVRTKGDRVEISAIRGVKVDDWDTGRTLAQNLADARRTERFPRTARVVAWGLHESAGASDALTKSVAAPLRDAGFTVDTIISPAQALVLLARRHSRRAGRDAAAWLAINRQGVAMAIVAAGELLYSREFTWHYREAGSVKEELLTRYSLVAHLAPEVRHGLDVVEVQRGVRVNAIVTCGDLPDLRSLTMPLIEELDTEVETLDTFEGLDLPRAEREDDPAATVPALCLASVAGVGGPSARQADGRAWLAAAAAVAVVAIGGWLAFRTVGTGPETVIQAPAARTSAASAPAPAAQAPRPAAPQPSAPAQATVDRPETSAPVSVPERPAPPLTSDTRAAATTGRSETTEPVRTAPRARPVPSAEGPLTDPLPVVNSILVAPDRRLAVVAGEIVHEGDRVGRRVLIRIERDALVLREPSGHEVRVPIRRRPG